MNNSFNQERKNERNFNMKAFVCVMLAFFIGFMSLSGLSFPIDAIAETVAEENTTEGNGEAESTTASDTPSYEDAVLEVVQDGTDLKFYAKNCVDLVIMELAIELDPLAVVGVAFVGGIDVLKINSEAFFNTNSLICAYDDECISDMQYVCVFEEQLWSSERFDEENISGDSDINGEYFHLFTLKLRLNNGYDLDDIGINLIANASFMASQGQKHNVENMRCNIITTEQEEQTTSASEETTAPSEVTTAPSEETTAPHTHDYYSKVTKKASCTDPGILSFICSCGDSYTEDIPSLGGHKLSWTVKKTATAFEEGLREGKCQNCNYTEKQSIEKLPEIAVKPENSAEAKISTKGDVLSVAGNSVEEFLKYLPENAVICTSDSKEAAKDAPIATGMKIIMKDKSGKTVDTKIIVVPGDVDCNGSVAASDARSALRNSVQLDKLESYQISAADINPDSTVTAADARTILRASVGLEDMAEIFRTVE